MSTWSLTCQRSVSKRYHIDKHLSEFLTYKMAAKISWHRYGTTLRHCRPICIRLIGGEAVVAIVWRYIDVYSITHSLSHSKLMKEKKELPFLQILPTAAFPFSPSGFTIWISHTVYCYF